MYKLLDYDITEYKQLENTLNELSKQGYNPTSLGKISRFEKNDKHYHYHVDLFIKKATTPKRKALHDFMNDYERNMFDYYGKLGKFIIFTTENKRTLPKERQKAIDEYLSTRKISVTTYFVLALFFAFFVAQLVLQKNQIQEFLTNGSILIHYLPLLLFATILVRCLYKISLACQKNFNKLIKKLFYVMSALTCLAALFGCVLDITERKDMPLNKNILTLEVLDKETNKKEYPQYKQTKSILVEASSYFEKNKQGDLMYSKDYHFKSNEKINTFFKRYLDTYDDVPVIKIDKNTYLFKLDTSYDTLLYKKGNHFYFVSANFSLKNNYQNIIKFYK